MTRLVTTQFRRPHGAGSFGVALRFLCPSPGLEIVSHCLCRDPQRRWTLVEIGARLRCSPATPQIPAITTPRKVFASWRYGIPAVASGLLLLGGVAQPWTFFPYRNIGCPTGFFLGIGDQARSVAIHINESGKQRNQEEDEYRGDSPNE